jgi:hypothetical protein
MFFYLILFNTSFKFLLNYKNNIEHIIYYIYNILIIYIRKLFNARFHIKLECRSIKLNDFIVYTIKKLKVYWFQFTLFKY